MPRPKRDIPWIDQRDGIYYAFWYNAAKRRTDRQSLGTRDAREAQAAFAQFLVDGPDLYQAVPKQSDALTVSRALDNYEVNHIDEKAVAKDRFTYAKRWLVAFFGDTPLKDIDIPKCRAYADERRLGRVGKKAINSTIRRELNVLVATANHAVKWKKLARADLPSIELTEGGGAKERWLTKEELTLLQDAAGDRTRDFIDIAYYTASRKTAVESLQWLQVDLERERIRLAKPGEQRTKKRRPVVPVAPELLPLLRRLRASALGACKDKKVVDIQQQYVLGHGGAIRTGFENAVKRAGLEPPRPWEKEVVQDGRKATVKLREPTAGELEDYRRNSVTPHTLRHSRITHLLQDGVDPWDVAGLAGDTLDTIMEVYGHHCPDHLAGVLKRHQGNDAGSQKAGS